MSKTLIEIQSINHEIMRRASALEDRCMQAIADGKMDLFNTLMQELTELQSGYVSYN